jgi:hypothetical protein
LSKTNTPEFCQEKRGRPHSGAMGHDCFVCCSAE